jgi:hypothetical protein
MVAFLSVQPIFANIYIFDNEVPVTDQTSYLEWMRSIMYSVYSTRVSKVKGLCRMVVERL